VSTLTVHPLDGSAPFVAWMDGAPILDDATLAASFPLIGQRLGLTSEGPEYEAGWATIEQAAVLLGDLYPHAGIVGDPSLDHLVSRPEGVA
jgi:hypothetical protein